MSSELRHDDAPLDPGAMIAIHGRPFTVERTVTCDPSRVPHTWPDHLRAGALLIEMRDTDGTAWEVVVPTPPWGRSLGVVALAPADHGGHYPTCGTCDQVWPCAHVALLDDLRVTVDAAGARIRHETALPWPCRWCERFSIHPPRRFRTRRGESQHARSCSCNPATWNLDRWVPTFDERLRIVGGFDPTDPERVVISGFRAVRQGDQARTLAEKVRSAALTGTVPSHVNEIAA